MDTPVSDCRKTPGEVSEGRSPPTLVPKLTTCASASEALRSKVSLQSSPAVPKAQGKTVSLEKIAAGELFRRPEAGFLPPLFFYFTSISNVTVLVYLLSCICWSLSE